MRVPGHPHAHPVALSWILPQVLGVVLGIVTYFGVRGLTVGSTADAVRHADDILAVERVLHLDLETGVQDLLLGVPAVTTLGNWVYIYGHWPVIAVTLVWLALRHPVHYVQLRDSMVVSGVMGLVVFATYPVAPPRLAFGRIVDTVTERSHAYRVLQPPAFVNQYAAMPSLHAGWDLLVGLSIAGAAGSAWLVWVGRTLPVLMALAVLVTGNHYVLDVLVGLLFALVGLLVARRVHRLRDVHEVHRAHARAGSRAGAKAGARTGARTGKATGG